MNKCSICGQPASKGPRYVLRVIDMTTWLEFTCTNDHTWRDTWVVGAAREAQT